MHGQRLYFLASSSKGDELWITDGTAKGTRRLTDFATPRVLYFNLLPSPQAGPLIFTAWDEAHGLELWTSDGTAQGTRLLRDICPGRCYGTSPSQFVLQHGNLYFEGNDGVRGGEGWMTDGTAAGTHLVRDICKGSCYSSLHDLVPMPGRLLFLADDGIHSSEIWATDGTARGTVRLTRFRIPGHEPRRRDGRRHADLLLFRSGAWRRTLVYRWHAGRHRPPRRSGR